MTRTTVIPDALAEAARWRLAGLLFERPREAWREEVESLAGEVDDEGLRAAAAAARDATEGDYLALVGPGGAVPVREVAYREGRDPGWLLADLRRYYEAFAYAPQAEDPADHFAVEAGFVGYLWLKEALARSNGASEVAAVTIEAREQFVADHLAGVLPMFARRLAAAGDRSHLGTAAAAIATRVPTGVISPRGVEESPRVVGVCCPAVPHRPSS